MRRRRARARQRWRWIRRSLLGLLILVLGSGAIGYAWLRTSLPQTRGRLALPGLHQPVEVLRDADGVPHIFAADDEDAYTALGFVHAQDRLFQMDFQRRLGAGRLAEVVGAGALPIDKTMRTLGLYRLAEASFAHLSPPVRRAFDAYARGVNAFLETREGAWPPEYYLLRTEPEPWRPADSLVWGRLMGLTLSGNWRGEALRARLAMRLTPQQLGDWYADENFSGAVTLSPEIERTHAEDALMQRAFAALPDALRPRLASNVWVVDGRHTATGKPILANDPHLGFGAPGIWYLARITTPNLTLAGATVAGVPFHILGQNDRVAWGMTTTGADTQDLVIERVSATDPGAYDTPDGPKKFETRQEVIHVRGGDDVALSVRVTRHGPVISDVDTSAAAAARDRQVIALAATLLRPDDHTPEALYGMNRAQRWGDFVGALERFETPMQNVFYADRDGTTAMMAPGLIPLRRTGNGFMPTPGWDDAAAWDGFIPFDELPRRVDPTNGVLVNANNRVVGDDYRHFISRDWDQPYRAQRIAELLAEAKGQTVARHQAIQLDIVSPMTAELLPVMLSHAEHAGRATEALRRLASWDGRMRRDTPEPLIFTAWLRALDRALFADELGDLFAPMWDLHPKLIARTLRTEAAWCDDVRTPAVETCAQQVTRALAEALDELGQRFGNDLKNWRWGDVHAAHHDHPIFGRIGGLDWLADLRIPADGGNDTINRAAMRVGNPSDPYADIHGPGYRAVYDLADPAASRFVITTGQSGNPLSRHYGDFLQRWRDGDSRPLTGTAAALTAAGADRLTLVPR